MEMQRGWPTNEEILESHHRAETTLDKVQTLPAHLGGVRVGFCGSCFYWCMLHDQEDGHGSVVLYVCGGCLRNPQTGKR